MPVTNVAPDELVDAAGNLVEVYTVTFTLADHPGAFTVQVPREPDPVAAAQAAIAKQTQEVDALYGL